ncbi:class I poly(R)-hydroxyalkanoic acid synthase [Pacificimonas sp. WHA3]|uniref:Class I poly(R)-hydroxyalkanoic acid synthase n=1 Tax=Pacificimonas pallii TaxID=2827236 RepID=A0ABS6SJ19_9SPHN|nr:class I poly(R)-hydroxyalkanoic acid synthase [Pacificimonas pallii]MBV7257867.1 class I poly(R)-hydroxyalkanoic acid synthase [Pacificimonas pallii]
MSAKDLQSDPAATFERMTYLTGKAQQMMMDFMARQEPATPSANIDPFGFADMWTGMTQAALSDPVKLAQMQMDYVQESARLWQGFLGGDMAAPVADAARQDKRFKSESWESAPAFAFIKQAYLMTSSYILDAVGGLDNMSEKDREKALFYTRQFVDAMSPTNYLLTNPDVLNATIESGGENLLKGTEHLLHDIENGRMRMTDEDAFEVGVNVAVTPGKVVFQNRLFQLIQYAPTTKQVYEIPLLIFPPWINKFYILDLTPEKSFIRWAVEQGLTVYVVSWKNADESTADVVLDSYVKEGFLEAIDQVLADTKAPAVHTIGYCVAGTTLAAVLALLAERGEADKVKTATFFTAQVDFEDAGELSVFIHDGELMLADENSREKGYLDGRAMATTFNMLRSNDLIWNYVVNNYLLGKDYFPFDLLFWNGDATNVPAKWHQNYLKDLYRDNKLVKPGAITIDGTPIDLTKVKTPSYVQAGKEDHIAPLKSVWKLPKHFKGPVRFLMAGSGHIAGVVNPPSAKKYQYWTIDGKLPDTLEEFQAQASETPGSWWPDWIAWLTPQSGKKIAARKPGTRKLKAIEDAPGSYVRERVA